MLDWWILCPGMEETQPTQGIDIPNHGHTVFIKKICLTWKVGAVRLPCTAMFLAGQTETLGLFQPFRPWSKKTTCTFWQLLLDLEWNSTVHSHPSLLENIPRLITTPYRTWNFDIRHCSTNKMQNKFDIRPLKYGNDMGGFPWKGVPLLRVPGKNHEKRLSLISQYLLCSFFFSTEPFWYPDSWPLTLGRPANLRWDKRSSRALTAEVTRSGFGWFGRQKKSPDAQGMLIFALKWSIRMSASFDFFPTVGVCGRIFLLLLRGSYMENSWSHRSSILVVSMSNSISLPQSSQFVPA